MSEQCSCDSGNTREQEIKQAIKERYRKVAEGTGCCSGTDKDAITRDLYAESETEGIPVEA